MTQLSGLFRRRGMVVIFKLEPEAVFKQAHGHGYDITYVPINFI